MRSRTPVHSSYASAVTVTRPSNTLYSTLLLLLLLTIFATTSTASVSSLIMGRRMGDISNPTTDPQLCGRPKVAKSAICDPDLYLKEDQKDVIEGYINAITTAEIAVVIIKHMNNGELFHSSSIEESSERFARHLHDRYGVGNKHLDNGILVFLSIFDRAIYISTGTGVATKLSHQRIMDVIANVKPYLKAQDYDKAVEYILIQIDLLLYGGKGEIQLKYGGGVMEKFDTTKETIGGFIFFVLVVGGVLGFTIYQDRKLKRYQRGKKVLDELMKEVDSAEMGTVYRSVSCPVCLEDFEVIKIDEKKAESEKEENGDGVETPVEQNAEMHIGDVHAAEDSEPGIKEEDLDILTDKILQNQDSKESKDEKAKDLKSKKRPMALRCGHTFCYECLETYLRTTAGNKCPICRADVEDGGHGGGQAPLPRTHTAPPQTSTAPQANGSANRPSCADQFRNEQTPSTATESDYVGHATAYETMGNYDTFYFARRAPSIRYRMDRMRTLYPDVMTYDLLRTLNSAVDRGSITDFRSHISARSVEVQQIMTRIRESTSSNAKRSGSLGRSRGFGGGRSSGGGGGRW